MRNFFSFTFDIWFGVSLIMTLLENNKKFYVIVGLSLLSILIYWIYIQFLPSRNTVFNYYFNVVTAIVYSAAGMLGYMYQRKSSDTRLRSVFLLFSLSLFSYSIGSFIWSYYNLISKADIPFPSLADIFYLLYPVCIGAGFWYILDILKFKPSKTNIKISLVIVAIIFFVVFFIFNKPTINSSQPVLGTMLNFLYPLSDSFLISLGIIALTTVRKIGYGMSSIVTALFFMAAGDIIFTYRQTNNLYWNGDISDLLFLVSAFLLSIGMYRLYIRSQNKIEIKTSKL